MVCHFRFVFTVECLIFPHSLMNNRLYDHIAFHLIQKKNYYRKGKQNFMSKFSGVESMFRGENLYFFSRKL